MADLSERDIAVLEFEGTWANRVGSKAAAARAAFGWSLTRHYQVLYALLARPEAVRFDPVLVHRLLRIKESRSRGRASRSAVRGGASE